MADVTAIERYHFLHSFRTVVGEVVEGLTASQSASTDTHWAQRHKLCVRVDLYPLLVSYHNALPIFNTFARKNRTARIRDSSTTGHSRTVDGTV